LEDSAVNSGDAGVLLSNFPAQETLQRASGFALGAGFFFFLIGDASNPKIIDRIIGRYVGKFI
jgi:hypothetical protein